jgi:uncharacterized SAM-binding protein YcdF (DUF218 family)
MEYDCCIVLAHELKKDKSLSDQTKERLENGMGLYFSGKLKKIIVSGNYKELFGISLAQAMKKYAIEKGVKEEDIIKEEISLESVGQLLFCKIGILEIKKCFKVVIISSDYHIERLKILANTIFDKKYKIDFIGVKSSINSEELNKIKKDEEKSKELFIKTFGSKPLGDKALLKILFEKHGRYNKNPKEFKTRLEQLKKNSI